MTRRSALAVACVLGAGCAAAPQPGAPADPRVGATAVARATDTTRAGWVPAGFGSLRQDDVAIRLERRDVLARAIPLDETVIRLLSPDSYRAMRDLLESRRAELERLATVHQLRDRSVWYVGFHGLAAEARFDPREVAITSGGREFRPLEVLPLSSGFGEHRLQPRETQSALYLFEDGIDLAQPLTVAFGTTRDAASWGEIRRTLDRERVLVRSRASVGRVPPARP